MKSYLKSNLVFFLILFSYSVYAGLFIFKTSFVIQGERFFSLFDDAMVSMRYAKNLANGFGLVWNPGGEKVEGYTNFLWMLYMALFHFLPLAVSKISLCIQISSLSILLANLFFVKKIAEFISDKNKAVSLGAVVLTAFYLPLNNWSLQGMEVGLLTLILSISVWLSLQCIKNNIFDIRIYVWLGLATLVRIDAVVLYLVIWMFHAIAMPARRNQNIAYGLAFLLIFAGGQTLFRWFYFGDILPNTYYLKMTGYPVFLRITRGLYVFFTFVGKANWLLFLIPFLFFFSKRDPFLPLLFSVFLGQSLYSIYVGGDAWEWWGGSNRYISIAMPQFFALISLSLFNACKSIYKNGNAILSKKIRLSAYISLIVLSLIHLNSIYGLKALVEFALLKPPLHVTSNRNMVEGAFLVQKMTYPDAKIAVTWAGALPYFSERTAVDILGKNDRIISKIKMGRLEKKSEFVAFYPGHLKWDYAYSIGKLKPDIVFQLWLKKSDATHFLEKEYVYVQVNSFHFYLRKNSPNIQWDKFKLQPDQ
jgi:hypothetical protein